MINTKQDTKQSQLSSSQGPVLQGLWIRGDNLSDSSGNGYTLFTTGTPKQTTETEFLFQKAIAFDGQTQWLGTKQPVLRTDQSFSIVAWVRLDSNAMNGKLALKANEHALTAVSQDSPTHSAFYLGMRSIEETKPDGSITTALKWNFTISPVDGSETGVLEWQHAHVKTTLDNSTLDKWVMLVGVCDVAKRAAYIYVPSLNETGSAHVPEEWTFWKAEGGLQIGRGLWLGRNVDLWPGSVGPVRAFSGVLKAEDIKRLYMEDSVAVSTL